MFHEIQGHWPRQEHFEHYMNNLRCTYSVTVDVDISGLRASLAARGMKAYPAQIYILARCVNRFPEFRMGLSPAGKPGYWDILHPSYTVFNRQAGTFSSIWTPYGEHFEDFYKAASADIERYGSSTAFAPKPDAPPNLFNVSSLPWLDFTAFNLNVFAEGTHLPPIFTLGQYKQRDGRTLLPLALQLHHAACDGYHAGRFVEAVRDMAQDHAAWL